MAKCGYQQGGEDMQFETMPQTSQIHRLVARQDKTVIENKCHKIISVISICFNLQYVHVGQPWVLTKPMPSENNKVCSNDMKLTKNFKSVGMTLAKVKEQDMTLAK